MYISPGHSLTWDAEGSAALLFGGADDAGHRNDAGVTVPPASALSGQHWPNAGYL